MLLSHHLSSQPSIYPLMPNDLDHLEELELMASKKTSQRSLIVDIFFTPMHNPINMKFHNYTIGSGRFKAWSGNIENLENLGQNLQSSGQHTTDEPTVEDILCEVLPKLGFSLDAPVEKIRLEGRDVFSAAKGALLISLDHKLTPNVLNAMIEQAPDMILCLD